MVAYNFHKRFEEQIKSGAKRQTIRNRGKRRHARPGEKLQLYFGQRTQYCRKIIDDPDCSAVLGIAITLNESGFTSIRIQGRELPREHWEQFARADGFDSLADMHNYWLRCRGTEPMNDGVLVQWDASNA